MPRNGAQSAELINGRTPIASSSRTPAGMTPSPHALSTGADFRSNTTVDRPRCAAWIAIASPAGPPPTMATSTFTAEANLCKRDRGLDHSSRQSNDVHRLRRGQLTGEESAQRFSPSHLAARSARERPGLENQDRVGADAGAIEHGLPDSLLQPFAGAAQGGLRQNQ